MSEAQLYICILVYLLIGAVATNIVRANTPGVTSISLLDSIVYSIIFGWLWPMFIMFWIFSKFDDVYVWKAKNPERKSRS